MLLTMQLLEMSLSLIQVADLTYWGMAEMSLTSMGYRNLSYRGMVSTILTAVWFKPNLRTMEIWFNPNLPEGMFQA